MAQGELTPSQLLTSGEKVAKINNKMNHSSSNHLVKQIEGLETDRDHLKQAATNFFLLVENLCLEHYSWLRR